MHVTDGLANLEETLILFDCLLVLSEVIKEDTRGVVSTTLISRFACTLACESENIVVL